MTDSRKFSFKKFQKQREPVQPRILKVDGELLSDLEEIFRSHVY